jgi:hypothetical protein
MKRDTKIGPLRQLPNSVRSSSVFTIGLDDRTLVAVMHITLAKEAAQSKRAG